MSDTRNFANDLALAHELADCARPIALAHFRAGTQARGKPGLEFDPVTAADTGVEAALRDLITRTLPEDGILGEEEGQSASRSGYCWVLDPIDGTRAFIAGLPVWTVLIALVGPDGPVLSVVDQPFTGERFVGCPDGQSVLHHAGQTTRLRTRETVTGLADAIFSTTDPGLFKGDERACVEALSAGVKIRRYGLDAYGYAALALGGIDLVVESGLKPWDVAALVPLVTGAGGVMTNWRGGACHAGGQVIAAASAALHEEALEMLMPAAD